MANLEKIAKLATPLMLSDAELQAVRNIVNLLVRVHENCEDGKTIPIYCAPSFALVFATIIESGLRVAE